MTTVPSQPETLKTNLFKAVPFATIALLTIMGFSLGLHLYNIDSIGDANAYYTAAVEAMLQSWQNFFFVAAEPGGSVSVDKPPLGLWIQAVFAYFLGVNGFTVSLPNILAGVLGIPVLYAMVRKYMGTMAGLVAGLVMALTPVFVATNRNNTMDGLLVFFLMLAAWAFIQATETGKLRWLLAGAFIVGLGFNIKMMQAFLPLPAFYALYFFGAKVGWLRKLVSLALATILLVVVSLSWAVAVDLTPADQRPYVGSSGDNTVMGLIFGHNGSSRLFGGGMGGNRPQAGDDNPGAGNPAPGSNPPGARQAPPQAIEACNSLQAGNACTFDLPNGNTISGACILPPNTSELACAPQGLAPQAGMNAPVSGAPNGQAGGTPFSQETGSPGVLRFFTQPLSRQMSWLLPFALLAGLLALFGARLNLPLEAGVHKSLLLWGGWLATCLVFFSAISGIFHAYYAIMLAPALGAVVGTGFAQLWRWNTNMDWPGVVLGVFAALTISFQVYASQQYGEETIWMMVAMAALVAGGVLLAFQRRLAALLMLAAMMVIPTYWTGMTITANPNQNLPTAYVGSNGQAGPGFARQPDDRTARQANINEDLLTYLQENTQDVEYLVAVPSSQQGASFVLATGRPVLYMGGFAGQDDVVSVDDLATMVANGELRYVLFSNGNKQEIARWLDASCSIVPGLTTPGNGPENSAATLYQCD